MLLATPESLSPGCLVAYKAQLCYRDILAATLMLLCTCSTWSMEEEAPLNIMENQRVIINCDGGSFNYRSNFGNLTLGEGSVMEYQNLSLIHI